MKTVIFIKFWTAICTFNFHSSEFIYSTAEHDFQSRYAEKITDLKLSENDFYGFSFLGVIFLNLSAR